MLISKSLGSNYKSATYPMKIFADELRNAGKPAQPGEHRLEYLIMDRPTQKYMGTEDDVEGDVRRIIRH